MESTQEVPERNKSSPETLPINPGPRRHSRRPKTKRKSSKLRLASSGDLLATQHERPIPKDAVKLKKLLLSEEDVDRSGWKRRLIEEYPAYRDFVERIRPVHRAVAFGEIYQPFTTQTKNTFSRDHVFALILDYLRHYGYKNTYGRLSKTLEGKALVSATHREGANPALVVHLKRAIADVETLYDLAIADKKTDEMELDAFLYDFHLVEEEEDDTEDVNVWVESDKKEVIVGDEQDKKRSLMAASLNAIVRLMTSTDPMAGEIMKTFLMTHHMYTTPQQLLAKLFERYDVPYTDDEEVQKEYSTIQLKVVNVIKKWLEKYYADFTPTMITLVTRFALDPYTNPMHSRSLNASLRKMRDGQVIRRTPSEFPEPHIPKNVFSSELSVFDIDSVELARQMTLIQFESMSAIKPIELLDQAWSKQKLKSRAPNVLALINSFNEVSLWVAGSILKATHLKERIKRMEKFIQFGKLLLQFNNYNTLMALLAGLNIASVHRLKHTMAGCSKESHETLALLEKIMSAVSSFKEYRASIAQANPPCIPYIGVYLTDLTFIDENPNRIDGLINFTKLGMIYDVIARIQQYQQLSYSFSPVYQIQRLLRDLKHPMDEAALYQMSLEREPRGASREELK